MVFYDFISKPISQRQSDSKYIKMNGHPGVKNHTNQARNWYFMTDPKGRYWKLMGLGLSHRSAIGGRLFF